MIVERVLYSHINTLTTKFANTCLAKTYRDFDKLRDSVKTRTGQTLPFYMLFCYMSGLDSIQELLLKDTKVSYRHGISYNKTY